MPTREYTPEFKARIALAVLAREKRGVQCSAETEVPQTLIDTWVQQLKESAAGIFSGIPEKEKTANKEKMQKAYAENGHLTKEEREFLLKIFRKE